MSEGKELPECESEFLELPPGWRVTEIHLIGESDKVDDLRELVNVNTELVNTSKTQLLFRYKGLIMNLLWVFCFLYGGYWGGGRPFIWAGIVCMLGGAVFCEIIDTNAHKKQSKENKDNAGK